MAKGASRMGYGSWGGRLPKWAKGCCEREAGIGVGDDKNKRLERQQEGARPTECRAPPCCWAWVSRQGSGSLQKGRSPATPGLQDNVVVCVKRVKVWLCCYDNKKLVQGGNRSNSLGLVCHLHQEGLSHCSVRRCTSTLASAGGPRTRQPTWAVYSPRCFVGKVCKLAHICSAKTLEEQTLLSLKL